MFSDSSVSYAEFQSGLVDSGRRDRAARSEQVQTEPLYIREGGIQTVRRKTVEVQTEISAPTLGGVDYDDGSGGMFDMPNDDPTALNAFIRRIGPLILSELEANAANPATTLLLGNWATSRNERSQRQIEVDAFGFVIVEDPQNAQQPQQLQTEEGCTLLRRVYGSLDNSSSSTADVTYLPASCLSWSPTGASLAVGFGHIRHDSWCAHGATSAVYIWSLESFRTASSSNASLLNQEKHANVSKPVWVLPHSACVTALAFHPSVAGLLASGSYTGDVVIWDTSRDESADPLLASTAGTALAQPGMNVPHADFIGAIVWLPIKASPTIRFLASACGDGLVCTWSVDTIRKSIAQLAGYKFPAGVCCLSLNPHDSTVLAAGLANGQLVFWSIDENAAKSAYALDPSLSTPSTPVYTVTGSKISAASGPIYSCEWSPACPGLCAVAASDGTVLLYSQREPTMPCLRLESSNSGSLFSVSFSRSRPLLLLTASQYDGAIAFDLASSGSSSILFRLLADGGSQGSSNHNLSTLCAEFNPASGRTSVHSLIALGRESGAVELWRVSMTSESNEADSAAALQSLRALVAGEKDQTQQQHVKSQKLEMLAVGGSAAPSGDGTKKKKKKKKEEVVEPF